MLAQMVIHSSKLWVLQLVLLQLVDSLFLSHLSNGNQLLIKILLSVQASHNHAHQSTCDIS